MNRLYKILLIWLLMLAVPVQGIAAGMQISCGPMHHGTVQAADQAAAHDHDHAGGAQHHHDHASMMQVDNGGAAQLDHDAAQAKGKSAGTCSACASCCVGAAVIPSALAFTPVHRTIGTLAAEPASSFIGYIPAGLDRPPRFILS